MMSRKRAFVEVRARVVQSQENGVSQSEYHWARLDQRQQTFGLGVLGQSQISWPWFLMVRRVQSPHTTGLLETPEMRCMTHKQEPSAPWLQACFSAGPPVTEPGLGAGPLRSPPFL